MLHSYNTYGIMYIMLYYITYKVIIRYYHSTITITDILYILIHNNILLRHINYILYHMIIYIV